MADRAINETIDERILRLLGLEDVFDLDYDTYLTLLKERIVKGSFGENKLPDEELALLSNERKRIRGKEGRFIPKVNKKKITAASIATTKLISPAKEISTDQLKGVRGAIVPIKESLDSIIKSLTNQEKIDKEKLQEDKKTKENLKRKRKEELLEGAGKNIVKSAQKLLSPVQNILDNIIRFITFTLLGRAFKLFMDWASDPKNKEKLETIGRFLKDWWPSLLGAWVLFATPLGKFVRTIVGTIAKLTLRLAKFAIPKLISFTKSNPLIAAGVIAGTATLGAEMQRQNEEKKQIENEASRRKVQPEVVKDELEKSKRSPFAIFGQGMSNLYSSGGNIDSIFSGIVDGNSGIGVDGAGQDTQFFPIEGGGGAVLQKGESVLQVGARERMIMDTGVDPLSYNVGPNANKPKTITNKIIGKAFGGLVGFNKGGTIGTKQPMGNLLNQKAILIYNRLLRGGMTPQAAAGIVANIGVETGYTYDPNTRQMGGGPGRGLAQWEMGGRYDTDNINLLSFAKKMSKPWNDLTTQIDFILHEMNNHPEYRKVKSRLNSSKTVQEATKIFLMDYEKAVVPHFEDRFKVANQLIKSGYGVTKKKEPKPKLKPSLMQSVGFMMPTSLPFMGGGLIKENTGKDIKGATADRQRIDAQPGEYILTKDVVDKLGVPFLDKLTANLDNNSTPAKLGKRKVNINVPEPPSRSRGTGAMITLPPIKQSETQQSMNFTAETKVPSFSVVSSAAQEIRIQNAQRYGILI
jgi:hypothetical protein